jgi:5-methylcytosine-specific restriction enzyme subunit McrC
MSNFIKPKEGKAFRENHEGYHGEEVTLDASMALEDIFFQGNKKACCVNFQGGKAVWTVRTSYFVGVDWVGQTGHAIHVRPKLDHGHLQTDYLKMLMDALQHPEVWEHTKALYEIKFDAPSIEISQQDDLLTPLLVVQFLSVMKAIVRKGLRKSYYRVERNLNSRIKGKVLVGKTIKENLLQNKQLHTFCSFDEFGVNSLENRLLKRALVFVERYWPVFVKNYRGEGTQKGAGYFTELFHYVLPAFDLVSEEVDILAIKHAKVNPFFAEYAEGIRLAKMILQRFGYHINTVSESKTVKVPPFWIDMSKLFELYVLGLLKDVLGRKVAYQFATYGNYLDFLLKDGEESMVIDAKYKLGWMNGNVSHEDVRQVSGYARLLKVYKELDWDHERLIPCLIVYPDQGEGVPMDFADGVVRMDALKAYVGVFKIAVRLPVVSKV